MLNSFLLASLFPWDFIRAVVLRRLSSGFFFFFPLGSCHEVCGIFPDQRLNLCPLDCKCNLFFCLFLKYFRGGGAQSLNPWTTREIFFSFFFFWPCYMAGRILVLLSRDQTQAPVKAMSSNLWTAKEVPSSLFSSSPAPHSNWHFCDSNLFGVMGLPPQMSPPT